MAILAVGGYALDAHGVPPGCIRAGNIFQQFWYFQLRVLPSAIHSAACATRDARVASRLASTIHSTYSRCWVGVKASKILRAPDCARSAAARSSGSAGASRFGLGA